MPFTFKPITRKYAFGEDIINHPSNQPTLWRVPGSEHFPFFPSFVTYSTYSGTDFVKHLKYDNYAFELPLEGTLKLTQRETSVQLIPGEVGIIHQQEDSKLETGPDRFCKKLAFGISGSFSRLLMRQLNLSEHMKIRLPDFRKILEKIERMRGLLLRADPAECSTLCGLALEILLDFSAAVRTENPPDPFKRILAVFSQSIPRHVTIRELAEKLNMSVTTLERRFREKMNESPANYLFQRKMETAMLLLETTGQSIASIAEQVGFPEQLAFSARFRQYTGCSPREYRKRSTRNNQRQMQ